MTRTVTSWRRRFPRGALAGALAGALVGVLLAGCSNPPYVHDEAAFNRNHKDFGRPRTDRENVTICYARNATTAREVAGLAEAECRAFGKTAVPVSQDLKTCPLMTPVAANYDCVDPATVSRPETGDQGFYTRLIQSLPRF